MVTPCTPQSEDSFVAIPPSCETIRTGQKAKSSKTIIGHKFDINK